jgi:hypothetical protein
MKERPILFSAPMVRAILEGRKTQTRRVVKPQPPAGHALHGFTTFSTRMTDVGKAVWARGDSPLLCDVHRVRCPYGQPGDRLVVRETWQYADWTEDGMPWIRYRADQATRLIEDTPEDWSERLTDAWASLSVPENYALDNRAADRRWRPAIHMPRWASRILLEVTGVRVERLQDISEPDAIAEGCAGGHGVIPGYSYSATPREQYRALWESINGPGSWDANPWVWVVEFKRIEAQDAAA